MKIDRSTIKLVDGFKVRNRIDDDFAVLHGTSNHATHYSPKFYIPEGEWWFDHRFKDEMDFFIKGEETMEEILETMPYNPTGREELKKRMCSTDPVPSFEIMREVKEDEGYTLVMVDGKIIRQFLDPEFVFGGHDLVYDYIPEKEIWLEAAIDPAEIPYILLHEKVERDLMAEGKPYEIAHEFATAADKELRRKDGVGHYPGDPNYQWRGKSNEEFAKEFYVE